ncbi:MAG: Lrp/AsnC family transcriptional regulator [Dehalococcoidia bacterium]
MKRSDGSVSPPDDLDRALMSLLREDGRRPAIDLAKELQVSEATVRKRMSRLIEQGMLRIVAASNLRTMGFHQEVMFLVRTQPGKTMEVAKALSRLNQVRFVAIGLGAFDLFVNAVFRGEEDLCDFVLNETGACPGINGIETFQVLSILKRTFDWLATPEAGASFPTTSAEFE